MFDGMETAENGGTVLFESGRCSQCRWIIKDGSPWRYSFEVEGGSRLESTVRPRSSVERTSSRRFRDMGNRLYRRIISFLGEMERRRPATIYRATTDAFDPLYCPEFLLVHGITVDRVELSRHARRIAALAISRTEHGDKFVIANRGIGEPRKRKDGNGN